MQHDSGDIWKARVNITGGSCKWTLSAVNLGTEYIDAIHLGKDLVLGTAVSVTLAFDNDTSRNGQFTFVTGDVDLSPKYYHYIREKKLGGVGNSLSLLGKEAFLSIRAESAETVVFSPESDEKNIACLIGVEKKIKGVHPKIIYPDGGIAPNKTLLPDFDVVDKM